MRPTEVIAQMQIKAQEKQRVLGVLPNFYTSYIWNTAPLNTRQKFSLSTRDLLDPVSLVGVAATAGLERISTIRARTGGRPRLHQLRHRCWHPGRRHHLSGVRLEAHHDTCPRQGKTWN